VCVCVCVCVSYLISTWGMFIYFHSCSIRCGDVREGGGSGLTNAYLVSRPPFAYLFTHVILHRLACGAPIDICYTTSSTQQPWCLERAYLRFCEYVHNEGIHVTWLASSSWFRMGLCSQGANTHVSS